MRWISTTNETWTSSWVSRLPPAPTLLFVITPTDSSSVCSRSGPLRGNRLCYQDRDRNAQSRATDQAPRRLVRRHRPRPPARQVGLRGLRAAGAAASGRRREYIYLLRILGRASPTHERPRLPASSSQLRRRGSHLQADDGQLSRRARRRAKRVPPLPPQPVWTRTEERTQKRHADFGLALDSPACLVGEVC